MSCGPASNQTGPPWHGKGCGADGDGVKPGPELGMQPGTASSLCAGL